MCTFRIRTISSPKTITLSGPKVNINFIMQSNIESFKISSGVPKMLFITVFFNLRSNHLCITFGCCCHIFLKNQKRPSAFFVLIFHHISFLKGLGQLLHRMFHILQWSDSFLMIESMSNIFGKNTPQVTLCTYTSHQKAPDVNRF